MMEMMMMYFHFRIEETILFQQWRPSDTTGYVFSCVATFVIAIMLEVLKFGRTRLARKPRRKIVDCCCTTIEGIWDIPETKNYSEEETKNYSIAPFTVKSISDWKHFVSSCSYFVQNFIDYSLMLVAMTYNYPFFFSIIIGHAVGYFFVGPLMTAEESDNLGTCCS